MTDCNEVFDRVRALVQTWIDAYPVEQFGEKLTIAESIAVQDVLQKSFDDIGLGRISGSMGRHLCRTLLKQLNALQAEMQEELSEKQG